MKRLWAILSSGWTLAGLIFGWLLFYVTWAVWGEEAFASYVALLGGNPAVQIVYGLFLLSLICFVFRHARKRFFEDRVRLAFWVVLPIGVVVYLTGFFMCASLRVSDQLAVGQGDTVTPRWQDESFTVERLDHGLGEKAIDTGGGIFQSAPKLNIITKDGRQREIVAFPPRLVGGTFYHVLYVDLAPSIILREPGGVVLQEGLMALRLLPPGVSADFTVEGLPYKFTVRVLPNEVHERGGEKFKTYQMRRPIYGVKIVKGESIVFEGDSTGGPVMFEGFALSFDEPSYWVLLEAARDPGLPVLALGLVLITLGLALMPVAMLLRVRGSHKDEEA